MLDLSKASAACLLIALPIAVGAVESASRETPSDSELQTAMLKLRTKPAVVCSLSPPLQEFRTKNCGRRRSSWKQGESF
jgi:hypothetical protein